MKAVLGAIGLNATLCARHLRMASYYPGYDVLIVWSPVDVRTATVCGALVFLVVVDAGARTIAASFSCIAFTWVASVITPNPRAVWPLHPGEKLALHLLYFAKSHRLQLVGFGHEALPDALLESAERCSASPDEPVPSTVSSAPF